MPGTLQFFGERRMEHVAISEIVFSEREIELRENLSPEDCSRETKSGETHWINLVGLHATKTIRGVGDVFGIHPLALEDIVNIHNRPKLDQYDESLFLVLKMMSLSSDRREIQKEHISIFLGPDYVLTFQEHTQDVFEPVRERLRVGKGRIRKGGAGYLAYALIDAVVDNYFLVLDEINERIEELETKIIEDPTKEALEEVYVVRRELLRFRKSAWPLREVIGMIVRAESDYVAEDNLPYYQDVYDHILQVGESIDTNREILSGLIDVYLSSMSNQTNEVMKVLTVMAAIFIPITFIAGVYGMNFDHIPELHWEYGYFVVWGVMLSVVGGLLWFFRKRGWI